VRAAEHRELPARQVGSRGLALHVAAHAAGRSRPGGVTVIGLHMAACLACSGACMSLECSYHDTLTGLYAPEAAASARGLIVQQDGLRMRWPDARL